MGGGHRDVKIARHGDAAGSPTQCCVESVVTGRKASRSRQRWKGDWSGLVFRREVWTERLELEIVLGRPFPVDDVASSGPEFFDVRYAEARMPWDFGGVPNLLEAFLADRREAGRVLIPGCGSAYEIETFSKRGWDAVGIDFSAVGVARARQLLGPLGSKVHHGDFFDYPLSARGFDAIYERGFLCSLPPEFRRRYARRMAKVLVPSGLLFGFFFMGPEDEPPPHPISQDELFELLGSCFAKLQDSEVEDSLPLYAGKERWQIWARR